MKETTKTYWELLDEYCGIFQENKVPVYMKPDIEEMFYTNVKNQCEEYRFKYMREDIESVDRHKLAAIMVTEGLKLNIINASEINQNITADNINIAAEKILILAALDFLKAQINKVILKEQDKTGNNNLSIIVEFSYPEAWACKTDFIDIISRTLYYAKKDYMLNAMELAEKFFLIEYISILIQHPSDADVYFSILKEKEHANITN